jgi:hypothetical protein
MASIIAVIPTRYEIDMLIDLLPCMEEATQVVIYDNGMDKKTRKKLRQTLHGHRLHFPLDIWVVKALDWPIYKMWNDGWARAQKMFTNPHIAILNDDIKILPGTLGALSKALDENPDIAAICPDYNRHIVDGLGEISVEHTTSTFGRGGLAGFAYMLNGNYNIEKIDETYHWWYGDDELVFNIEKIGYKVAILRGVPIDHAHGTSYKYIKDELEAKIEQDRQYFNKKYGENRQRW